MKYFRLKNSSSGDELDSSSGDELDSSSDELDSEEDELDLKDKLDDSLVAWYLFLLALGKDLRMNP